MGRLSWDEYFMQIASIVAKRSTCHRLSVGCVITKDNRILSTGYNGSPTGMKHCSEVGCIIVDEHCIRSLHAEQNAVIQIARGTDLTAYVTHYPCVVCSKMLINLGVTRVVCTDAYYNKHSDGFFYNAKVEVIEHVHN